MRELFRHELVVNGLEDAPYSEAAFRRFIETVLEFVGRFHGRCRPTERDMEPAVETGIEQEIAAFLGRWLKGFTCDETATHLAPDTAAAILSWALFGAGVEWSRGPEEESAAERAGQVLALLLSGLSTLTPPTTAHRGLPLG